MSSTAHEQQLIAEAVRRVLEQLGADSTPRADAAEPLEEPARTHLKNPRNARALERLVAATPARLAVGRTGTRYPTSVYLRLRADHAIAKEAVYSEVPSDFAKAMHCVELRTRAPDRETYLLRPDEGRALHLESRAAVERDGTRDVDVQIILGDGLSAWALTLNAPALVPAIERELSARGLKTGKRLFVRFARIAVADEIGDVLRSKCTVILVGERPGLGTGDSLSAYIAYGPKLGQDNAEKNCVSNIRPAGLDANRAANEIVAIVARAFQLGHGGVAAAARATESNTGRRR